MRHIVVIFKIISSSHTTTTSSPGSTNYIQIEIKCIAMEFSTDIDPIDMLMAGLSRSPAHKESHLVSRSQLAVTDGEKLDSLMSYFDDVEVEVEEKNIEEINEIYDSLFTDWFFPKHLQLLSLHITNLGRF